MKKIRFFTLLTFVFAITLCSCSSDDEEQKKEELSEAQLLGDWGGYVRIDEPVRNNLLRSDGKLKVVVTFESGGVGSMDNMKMPDPEKFAYKIDGKTVSLTLKLDQNANKPVKMNVLSINDKTMDVKFVDDKGVALYGDQTITFTKEVWVLPTQLFGSWLEDLPSSQLDTRDVSGLYFFFQNDFVGYFSKGVLSEDFAYAIEGKSVFITLGSNKATIIEFRVRLIDDTKMLGRFYKKGTNTPFWEDRSYSFTKGKKP